MHTLLVILHVLGATVWTGGHLVLAIGFLPAAMKARDPQIIMAFESRFERIGIPALVVQVLTGILLAARYLPGDEAPMSGTALGWLVVKFVLLALTLGLALDARLRLIPRLGPHNLRALALHIIPVTLMAVLFVVAGVFLHLAGPG